MTVSTPVRQHIRILDAQGVSWRRMAREVGVSRQTAGKYAELEDCSPKPPEHAKSESKLDPFKPVIDKWLESDRLMPRKQRHTAMRVRHRLRDEHGYEGSNQLVRRYVRQRKRDWRDPGDGFMEPRWEPGIAQVDFGEGLACIRGARVKAHCLVAAFPYSNMRWVVALFRHIGLASRVLVFDNATGAAHRVAWGKITVVDVFRRFVEHYRVEVGFRNPASGWEKGNVENAVGFLRRDLMVPMPNAESYRRLASWMLSRCDGIAGNTHCRKDVLISDLFAGEKTRMLPLSRVPYDVCRWVTRRADREGQRRDRFRPLPRRPLVAWLDPGGRFARVPGGDPHPGRPVRGQAAARVRQGRPDGEEPGGPAARFGAQVARVGRIPHPRRFPRQAPSRGRRHGLQDPPAHVPPPGQGRRRVRLRCRGKGRRAHRGAGPLGRRGKPDGHGQTRQRRRNPGRRPGTGPARV